MPGRSLGYCGAACERFSPGGVIQTRFSLHLCRLRWNGVLSTPIAESLAAVFGDRPLELDLGLSEEITHRETEVLRMLAEGLVNKDIATRSRYLRAYNQVPYQLDSRQAGCFHSHRSGYTGNPARAYSNLKSLPVSIHRLTRL